MPATPRLDEPTLGLIRLAAAVAAGDEAPMRRVMAAARTAGTPPAWVEELLLQSVLMVGYPRALVAFGLWRQMSGLPARAEDEDSEYRHQKDWEARGEATCRQVYGGNYAALRRNVRALHPAMDRWMQVEGYGRTLSRPALDLLRRELCTVVQTAVLRTHRQLHSHLRGALHAGATPAQVEQALEVVLPLLAADERSAVDELWAAVRASGAGGR